MEGINWGFLLQVLAALGGAAGIAAIVRAAIERRRTNAEASSIEQDANTKIINNLSAENQRLHRRIEDSERDMDRVRNQLRELSERISIYDLEMNDLRVIAMGNISWSRRAYEALNKANDELAQNNVSINYTIEPPPDASNLISKFAYIESRMKHSE
jgi:predicted  nucleic acid-binding Zn-ribbon protein